jgi:lipopolysaccharide transport system ATP-binding protein
MTVIKVENLSKQYRLGEVGTGSMKDDIKRWRYRMMGKEDPFLKIGEENDRTVKSRSEYVWALRDINFEVNQGEVLGIIGRNGAGKSTLLKILSRTTGPTTGIIKMKGRVASLLEVGTGFHGELSGRENIYLNGAIMGMRKEEITRKLDEIVDFAGVEKYIDTPVKRYSSGMYVRLAFAVAAHLEPDIMIVDEVLAVGDAEFQKKAIGKMKDVSIKGGRTVLFVSHNMNAIQSLCESCIFMENGKNLLKAETNKVLSLYLKSSAGKSYQACVKKYNQEMFLQEAHVDTTKIPNEGIVVINTIIISKLKTKISIDFKLITDLSINVAFASIGALNYNEMIEISQGQNKISLNLNIKNLALGKYVLSIDLTQPNVKYYDRCDECLSFDVIKANDRSRQLEQGWNYGYVILPLHKV